MLNFFRKIRRNLSDNNQFVKYSKYAFGEVLLVVVGILIALQVNNWNTDRKEYQQFKKYAISLKQDLEKDIEMIKVIQYSAEQIELRIDSLSNYVRNREVDEISNLNLVCLTWMNIYRPYSWNRATIEELKSSGSMRLIKDKELSKKIVAYDANTHHMDEDYNTDKVQSDNALKLLSGVINNNFPNYIRLNEVIRATINEGQLKDVFLSEAYKEAQSYEILLNTENKEVLTEAINNYIRIQFNIGIRTKIELPELIDNAHELIILLNEITE